MRFNYINLFNPAMINKIIKIEREEYDIGGVLKVNNTHLFIEQHFISCEDILGKHFI